VSKAADPLVGAVAAFLVTAALTLCSIRTQPKKWWAQLVRAAPSSPRPRCGPFVVAAADEALDVGVEVVKRRVVAQPEGGAVGRVDDRALQALDEPVQIRGNGSVPRMEPKLKKMFAGFG